MIQHSLAGSGKQGKVEYFIHLLAEQKWKREVGMLWLFFFLNDANQIGR